VRMVLETIEENGGERYGVVTRIPFSSASAWSHSGHGSPKSRSMAELTLVLILLVLILVLILSIFQCRRVSCPTNLDQHRSFSDGLSSCGVVPSEDYLRFSRPSDPTLWRPIVMLKCSLDPRCS
jgi:hypothetical protein